MTGIPRTASAVLGAFLLAFLPPGALGAQAPEECKDGTPGYLCVEPRALWESAVRWRAKAKDAAADAEIESIRLAACRRKLSTRTPTVAAALVTPENPAQAPEAAGHSTAVLILTGAAALLLGAVVAALAKGDGSPAVVVAK